MEKKISSEDNINFLNKESSSLYFLCLLIGVLTGFIVSFYRYCLKFASILRAKYLTLNQLNDPQFLIKIWILFILIGFIVDFIYRKLPTTSGSGVPQVKAIILRKLTYKKWFSELLGKFIGGFLGIGAGLSLGREGPSVQLGSYVAFGLSKIFKKNIMETNYLVTSGASAGLSGAFGAPLAGVMFSLEELHKYFSTKLLICTLLASIASDFVGRRIFGISPAFVFHVNYPLSINPYFQFLLFILFGIIVAIFGKLFTTVLIKTQDTFTRIPLPRWLKISSVMTLSFVLCFILPEVSGGGHDLVETLVHSQSTLKFLIILFFIKLFFTAISYSTSFPGGIFLPMLVLGAVLGKIYALFLINVLNVGYDFIPHYMVLGMAAYFVAVVRAPITGIILILEMTGSFEHLLALTTVSLVAYYVTEIMKLEPIYEILYKRMKKDEPEDDENPNKTVITIPIIAESYLDGKIISEVVWPEEILIVAIEENGVERIPSGSTRISSGSKLFILMSEKKARIITELLYHMGTEK
ncbi:ClC family H(+)/Cl(-) exchange transporter [Cetobacterium sp. 2A]|uniref:ClC family H(+)/Cl(-) exchange transporter n=1 Tax=Cetobacterium sp. 2A TaxID=2754723 RepID=UPI00163C58DB|nr:ClC family H(+)/Cl(-) exchange transporter [Cetobacterium sp. 2A]MBC2856527.1 ClC family H(+)/Cl(-) exchange transporter [Cetobacterium sp. 2A]